MNELRLTIYGHCYSLKNSKMLAHSRTIKHAKARQFEKDFQAQCPRSAMLAIGSPKQHITAYVAVYYPSFRQDLSVEIVFDQLQKCGVVQNDRWIRTQHLQAFVDAKNPRVEIRLEW